MKTSETIGAIALALVKVEAAIEDPVKEKSNPAFKSKYADLKGYLESARPVLAEHEIVVMQGGHKVSEGYELVTRLVHSSGEWVEHGLPLVIDTNARNPMQSLGSALTYARRYGLASLLGMSSEDDDGHAAGRRPDNGHSHPVAQRDPMEEMKRKISELAKQLGIPGHDLPSFAHQRELNWPPKTAADLRKVVRAMEDELDENKEESPL